jgi:hypothetical protein
MEVERFLNRSEEEEKSDKAMTTTKPKLTNEEWARWYVGQHMENTKTAEGYQCPMPLLREYPDGPEGVRYMVSDRRANGPGAVLLLLTMVAHRFHMEVDRRKAAEPLSHQNLLAARREARAQYPAGHPDRVAAERAVRQSRKARAEASKEASC